MPGVGTREEKAALARAVLAHAEQRTGARSVVREVGGAGRGAGARAGQGAAGWAGGSTTGWGPGRGGGVTGASGPAGGTSASAPSGPGVPVTRGGSAPVPDDVRASARTPGTAGASHGAVAVRDDGPAGACDDGPGPGSDALRDAHPGMLRDAHPGTLRDVHRGALRDATDTSPHPVPDGVPGAHVPVARRTSLLTTERPALPVPAELTALLPDGLRRGGTVTVLGSTSLLLALLASACAGGAWAALVGQPTAGLLAAAEAGVALDRLAVVPAPGLDAPTVVAALLDGVDVVLVGPEAALTDGDRRRLAARARERGSVLLTSTSWPGAHVVLTAEQGRWSGVGTGDGRLRTHELRVVRTGRGSAAVPATVDLALPLGRPAPALVEPRASVTAASLAPAPLTAPAPEADPGAQDQPAATLRLVG